RCGTPAPSTSPHRVTPSSAGPPTRGPGCPPCRECTRPTPCRAADKPCIGVPSSMASDSSDPPVEPDDPDATVEDPEAPVPNRARKARTWAAAAVVARLTAVRAWLVPRLPRLVVTIVAGWLLLA